MPSNFETKWSYVGLGKVLRKANLSVNFFFNLSTSLFGPPRNIHMATIITNVDTNQTRIELTNLANPTIIPVPITEKRQSGNAINISDLSCLNSSRINIPKPSSLLLSDIDAKRYGTNHIPDQIVIAI